MTKTNDNTLKALLIILTILITYSISTAQITVTLTDATGATYTNTLQALGLYADEKQMDILLKNPFNFKSTQKVNLTINGIEQNPSELTMSLHFTIAPTPQPPPPTPLPTPCSDTPIAQPIGPFPAIPFGPGPTTQAQLIPFLENAASLPGICQWLLWAKQSQSNLNWVWNQSPYSRPTQPSRTPFKPTN